MIESICPIPSKKQRITPENSDTEDLNLSEKFDEDYRILMNEEILKNCKQTLCFNDPIEPSEVLSNFLNLCEELLQNIEDKKENPKRNNLCRCDRYLQKCEKVSHIKRLFELPRFTNITVLADLLISSDQNLAARVQDKLDEIQRIWDSKDLELDKDLSHIISDIGADLDDLSFGIQAVDEKLNVRIDGSRMQYVQCFEAVLNDCKVHNYVNSSISKTIEKVTELDSQTIYHEAIWEYKIKLEELTKAIYVQWLKALELKVKLEAMIDGVYQFNFGPNLLGPESGFESEISPMNPARGLPRSGLTIMKYISSSGECLFDNNTTDFPRDSESPQFSPNLPESRSDSSSLVGNMLELPARYQTGDEDSVVRRKHKRLKKRRQQLLKSEDAHPDNLSVQSKERYLQICNAFSRQPSNSLKRRIHDTSFIQTLDKTDITSSRISDLAAAAEKIVMKIDVKRNNSFSESPKESENDDGYNLVVSSANELNVKDVWDNYQASLYSNDDGDSEYVEVDKIKNWEQDIETDDQGLEICSNDINQVPMLTSGYETSLESEMHLCNKNLIIILQYSANEKVDVAKRLDQLTRDWDSGTGIPPDRMETLTNELLFKSNFHIKLLNQILINEPCGGTQVDPLLKQMRLLQADWEEMVRKSLILQSKACRPAKSTKLDRYIEEVNQINYRISKFNSYSDLIGLESSILLLRESRSELSALRTTVLAICAVDQDVLEEDAQAIMKYIQLNDDEIDRMLQGREGDLEIFQSCASVLEASRTKRMLLEAQFKGVMTLETSGHWDSLSCDALGTLKATKETLECCLQKLQAVPPERSSVNLGSDIGKELKLVDKLLRRLKVALPLIEDLKSKIDLLSDEQKLLQKPARPARSVCGFLNRVPVQMAILVIAVMCGLWYKNQAAACQGSLDWFRMFRKYTDSMEPH